MNLNTFCFISTLHNILCLTIHSNSFALLQEFELCVIILFRHVKMDDTAMMIRVYLRFFLPFFPLRFFDDLVEAKVEVGASAAVILCKDLR